METADAGEPVGGDARPDDFVQSVGRAMRVLEVVGNSPGLPVKSIARRSGLNISTTYHLVRTLAYEGYLRRLPEGTYVIGSTVARRFHDLLRSLDRPPGSTVVLSHLVERTGLSSYLGCLSDNGMTVVEMAEGPGSPHLEDLEAGLDVAAHATALGKALLTALPARARRAFLGTQHLRPFTARTCTDPVRLDHELEAMAPGTVVVEHGEFREGVACAAGLVPGTGAGPAWAVVVSVRGGDVPVPVQRELLLAARDLGRSAP